MNNTLTPQQRKQLDKEFRALGELIDILKSMEEKLYLKKKAIGYRLGYYKKSGG